MVLDEEGCAAPSEYYKPKPPVFVPSTSGFNKGSPHITSAFARAPLSACLRQYYAELKFKSEGDLILTGVAAWFGPNPSQGL